METKHLKKSEVKSWKCLGLVAALSFQLVACDTTDLLAKNNTSALKPNERATRALESSSRMVNVNEHQKQVDDYIQKANEASAAGDLDSLDIIYHDLATYDPGNLRAEQGLKDVEMARRHTVLLEEAKSLLGKDDEAAMLKLHEILLERPDHPVAKRIFDTLVKKKEDKQLEKSQKKLVYKNPVTMDFRDVSLKMIFEALSKTTNISFILDKDVPSDQKATIFVKGMAFPDALDLLLQTNQLEKKVLSETAAIIYPNDPLRQREYKDLTVRNFTLEYADVKETSNTLKSMLNIHSIEIDPRLNGIMIKDSPEVLALAEKLIQALDQPDPEVLLEMEVLEVNRSKLQNLGVKFPTSFSMPIPATGLTLGDLKHTSANSYVVGGDPALNFGANDSDVNLLANPRIRVKNKDVAKIHIGEKVPVFTANISSTGVSSQTIQYIDAGLKLEAEPNISSSGDVTIKINLNVGSIGDTITNGQSTAFRVGTRSATTQLRLHDGETQILAGLIDDEDRKNIDKVPGIAGIPLLGRLFSNHNDSKSKTEIVLSITPHIIRERTLGPANQTEFWIGSETQTGKGTPSPNFNGASPFTVPKPPASQPTIREEKPQSLNVPLPSGFSLGEGLNPKSGE